MKQERRLDLRDILGSWLPAVKRHGGDNDVRDFHSQAIRHAAPDNG